MNLLIFLDLTYNPCKNFKFYSLQGQNVQIILIFTYNQGKIFLILPITWKGGGLAHVYLVSIGSSPPQENSARTIRVLGLVYFFILMSKTHHTFCKSACPSVWVLLETEMTSDRVIIEQVERQKQDKDVHSC